MLEVNVFSLALYFASGCKTWKQFQDELLPEELTVKEIDYKSWME